MSGIKIFVPYIALKLLGLIGAVAETSVSVGPVVRKNLVEAMPQSSQTVPPGAPEAPGILRWAFLP